MLYASVDDTAKLPKEFRIMIIIFVPYLVWNTLLHIGASYSSRPAQWILHT